MYHVAASAPNSGFYYANAAEKAASQIQATWYGSWAIYEDSLDSTRLKVHGDFEGFPMGVR